MSFLANIDWQKVVGTTITIASILSNVIPSYTIVGKLVNFLAGNWNKRAIASSLPEMQNGVTPEDVTPFRNPPT